MAVELKFNVGETKDCKNITFTETTGIYNATSNLTGWGAPNELTTDATIATLLITDPSGTVYPAIDLLSTASFPKTDGIAAAIPSTSLSTSLTKYADGFYTMTYSVTTATTTYTTTNTIFLYCQIEQLVCKLVAALDICDCVCDRDKVDRALQAQAYLYAIQCAIQYDEFTKAKEIFSTLQRLLNCTTC